MVSDHALKIKGIDTIEPVKKWINDFDVDPVQLGLFLPKDVPANVINTLNHIWETRIANSKDLAEFVKADGGEMDVVSGPKAQARVWPSIQDAAWIYHAGGMTKVSPDTLGIHRR